MKKRINKIFIVATGIISIASHVQGQDEKKKSSGKFEYSFNAGFGYFFPLRSSKFLGDRGPVYSTNFQVTYKKHFLTHLFFDMVTVDYHKENINVNNVSYTLDYKLNANNIGIDLGYTYPVKKFAPYFFIGTGLSLMDTPFLKPGEQDQKVVFGTRTHSFLMFRGSIGLDYEISRSFILYLDGQYSTTAFRSVLDNKSIQGLSLQVGFKTPL